VGASSSNTTAKPIIEGNILPGFVSAQEERATVTNNSGVALDLWMHFVKTNQTGLACDATKVAWQSSIQGSITGLTGYSNVPPLPSNPGLVDGTGASLNFTRVNDLATVPVKIMDDQFFTPGAVVAVRQIAGFATDAVYGTHSGNCAWTEVFTATLPDVAPVI